MEHALHLALNTVVNMVDTFFIKLPNIVMGVAVFVVFLILGRTTKDLVNRFSIKARVDPTLARALAALCCIFVYVIGTLIAAVIVIPNFSMASVIGGLGISSVAIGFAFKDILQNFFAGMLLLGQKPFRIGDQIKTKDFEGIVEDITIRSTLLRTFTGELVIIPNGDIYTNPIVVTSASGKRQVHLPVSIKEANSNVEQLRQKIVSLVSNSEGVASQPKPNAYVVSDPGSDTLSFDVYFWTSARQEEVLSVTDRIFSALRQQLHHNDSANDKLSKRQLQKQEG